jgi:hypothetical protein
MFDPTIIKNEFLGLVGFRQTNDPDFQKLAGNLIYTGQNTLINHPLINAENLEMTAKQFAEYNYPQWVNITPYIVGDRVKNLGIIYEAITNNTGQDPVTSPLAWEVIDLFSLYLQDIIESTAEQVVNDMFNEKRESLKTKTLISSMRFYEGPGNLNDKILNTGKLVGVMIEMKHSQNLVNIIERIGLQLSGAANNIPIYIFHSSQPEAIQTILINQTVSNGFQWHNPSAKIKLHNLNQAYDTGGYFFIMYDQNNIGGNMAINKRMNFHLQPCGSCSAYNHEAFTKITKFTSVRSCHVDLGDRVTNGALDPLGIDLWDIEKTKFDLDYNWGLNFDFTIRCDLTEFIVRQKDVFAYALRDNVIVRLLDNMVNSTRQNNIDTKVSQMAQIALSDQKLGGGGLRHEADESIDAINFEVSNLDSVCMPCAQEGGIKVKSFSLQHGRNNLTGR